MSWLMGRDRKWMFSSCRGPVWDFTFKEIGGPGISWITNMLVWFGFHNIFLFIVPIYVLSIAPWCMRLCVWWLGGGGGDREDLLPYNRSCPRPQVFRLPSMQYTPYRLKQLNQNNIKPERISLASGQFVNDYRWVKFSVKPNRGHGSGMRSRHFGSGEGAEPVEGASTAAVDQSVDRATPAAGLQDCRTTGPQDSETGKTLSWPRSCAETPLACTRPDPPPLPLTPSLST